MKKNINMQKLQQFFQNCKGFPSKIKPFLKHWSKLSTWKNTFFLPEYPQENARLIRFLLFTLVSVFILIGLIFLITFQIIQLSSRNVRVPNIEKLSLDQAISILNNEQLNYHIDFSFNKDTKKFEILSQTPKRGTSVKIGRNIRLVVSLGRDEYIVPLLSGKTREEGVAILEEQNIPYQLQIVPANGQAVDIILATDKIEGAILPRDEVLILTVTDELLDDQFRLLNFVNQPIEYAVNTLYSKKLNPILITSNVTDRNLDSTIIAQDISPDTILQKGDSVQLTVGLYANDASEAENLRWNSIYYYIPLADNPNETETNPSQPAGRSYRAELEDQLGSRRTIYERLGAEGSSFVRVFKSFGASTVYIYADNDLIGTRNFD